jgi:hypothetical protein
MALSVTVHGFHVKTGAQTTGRLATADITLADGLDTVVYTLPESPTMLYGIISISICNRDVTAANQLALGVSDSVVPKLYDFVEWNTTIVPRGVLERTQITLTPGQSIVVRWGTAPTELVPDHEILDYAGSWTGSVTGTGVIDSSTSDQVQFTLEETDTGSLTTSPFAVVAGNTYRVALSFLSTEVTGTNSAIELVTNNGVEDVSVITLALEDRNRIDDYRTYTADLAIDNATDFTDSITQFTVNLADVEATIDRISLIQIA